jgi:GMP synthase-like glutamine amidotransferase
VSTAGSGLILEHEADTPPGLLAEWARQRGISFDLHRTYEDSPPPRIAGRSFVCCLGSSNSPLDRHLPAVRQTLALIGEAVASDVPVLGLCYGGQVLADVLGAEVQHAPEPEIGWYDIETDEPELISAGPWLEWHYERFTLPPGARELARSAAGVQAFSHGPHLGTQFHPESTVEIVSRWAAMDTENLDRLGIDAAARLEAGRDRAPLARTNAFRLFDGFWQRALRAERSSR